MRYLATSLSAALGGVDALRLAVIFVGLVGLGVLRIGLLVIKHIGRRK